jgi:O-antigen/teichoic acid export membrane protein
MNLGKIAKDSSYYLVGSLAGRAVGIVMTPIYARFLSPSEYGAVELLELCTQVVVISIGIQAIGGALVRIYYDYDDRDSRTAVVSTALLSTAVAGGLAMVLAWLCAPAVSRWLFHTSEHTLWIRVAFLAMFLSSLAEVGLLYQRLRDRVSFVVTYSVLQLVAALGLNIYFIAFQRVGVWGFILSKLITSVVGGAILVGMLISENGIRWHREQSGRLNSFGLPLILTGIAMFVIHFSDRFFINHYDGLQDVGTYSLAYKFAFLISFLVGQPFSLVWNINLYASSSSDNGWNLKVGRAFLYLMFSLFFLGLGISIFALPILSVLASKAYLSAASLIPILVLGYVAREIGDFFRIMLYAKKRAYVVSVLTVLCALLNTTFNFLLIPRYGSTGAAWSTLVTWLAYMMCCWVAATREFNIPFRLGSFVKICGTSVVIYGLSRVGFTNNSFLMHGRNVLLMILFCISLLTVRYLPKGERSALSAAVSRRLLKAF